MKQLTTKTRCLIAAVAGFLSASSAWALPTLQLDIQNGAYDSATQTIVNTTDPFNLWALYDTTHADPTGSTFYIAAAIVPKVGPSLAPGQFGSFVIDGTTYNGSSPMTYGTPPLSALYPDLPSHDIYQTYYAEIGFTFSAGDKALAYDSATTPGGLVASSTGTLKYHTFNIDVSGLAPGYELHLDLYDEWVKLQKKGKGTITTYQDNFAPFSHDAEGHQIHVPDGGSTLALIGFGFTALGLIRRKLS